MAMRTTDRTLSTSSGVAWFLLSIGVVARLAPLFNQGGRLLRQFPTEDGYLMLTIAHNMAIGKGVTIADGTIPTNGTQPLAAILYAACFWIAGGDKTRGVLLVQIMEFAISGLCAWFIYTLGKRLMESSPAAGDKALLAAAAWYASPMVVSHSMNCLESGLYVCLLTASLWFFFVPNVSAPIGSRSRRWVLLGLFLGLTFWARNDAVLLCLMIGVFHLFKPSDVDATRPFRTRLYELVIVGLVSLLVATPWLLFNYSRFGNIVPISGQAESIDVAFATNLTRVFPIFAEYITLYLPIPAALERKWWVVLTTITLLGVTVILSARASRRWTNLQRSVLLFGCAYCLLLGAFYGLYFGAGHFMSRYILPASPLIAVLWSVFVYHVCCRAVQSGYPLLSRAILASVVVLALGLNLRTYRGGSKHMHFQVVEWVEANLPESTWVGAIQTGTLGFFHDRTINLDGKVNPYALEARKRKKIPEYVVEQEIEYLADWAGLAIWQELKPIATHFDLIVKDEKIDLVVFRRKTRIQCTSLD